MQGRWEEKLNEKVVALDIDGVLNMYPDPWVNFLNNWLDTEYEDLNQVKNSVPYQKYRDIKWQYRESGVKATLPVREGAVELTKKLDALGYSIILLTSRPFNEHKSLFKQTTDFLTRNGFIYDGLIFGENKHTEILQRVPNLAFMVEDHRYYANMVSKWGYTTFLVNNLYNQGLIVEKVQRINELKEVLDYARG